MSAKEKRYRIKDVGSGFDGLLVTGRDWREEGDWGVEVFSLTDGNVLFGDRNLTVQLAPDSLFINPERLVEVAEEPKQFDSRNPFGKFRAEVRHTNGGPVETVAAKYERALTVTMLEKVDGNTRTRFTRNYYDPTEWDLIMLDIEDAYECGAVEDLVWKLQEVPAGELSDG